MRFYVEYIHVDCSTPMDPQHMRRSIMDMAVYSCKTETDATETASLTSEAVLIAFCRKTFGREPSKDLDRVEYNVLSYHEWCEAREANGDMIIQLSWQLNKNPPVMGSDTLVTPAQNVSDFDYTGVYTG